MKTHRVSIEDKGKRLDIFMMSVIPDITRSKIQYLIKENKISIDSCMVKPSYILKGMEQIDYEEIIMSDI